MLTREVPVIVASGVYQSLATARAVDVYRTAPYWLQASAISKLQIIIIMLPSGHLTIIVILESLEFCRSKCGRGIKTSGCQMLTVRMLYSIGEGGANCDTFKL